MLGPLESEGKIHVVQTAFLFQEILPTRVKPHLASAGSKKLLCDGEESC